MCKLINVEIQVIIELISASILYDLRIIYEDQPISLSIFHKTNYSGTEDTAA